MSATVRVPLAGPTMAGLNVTLIAQFAPGASVEPQLLVCENGPLMLMLERFSPKLPELVSVAICDALEVPTA